MIAFTGLAFLLSILEHEIKLRENLETEFGLEHENDRYKRAAKAAQSDKDLETVYRQRRSDRIWVTPEGIFVADDGSIKYLRYVYDFCESQWMP